MPIVKNDFITVLLSQKLLTYDQERSINYVVFKKKTSTRGESFERFYGRLEERGEKFQLVNPDETFIRDVFIDNMLDIVTQTELPRKTVDRHQKMVDRRNQNSTKTNELKLWSWLVD